MKRNRYALLTTALAALSLSPALADGFSANLNVGILPSPFSIGTSLNYTYSLTDNVVVGGRLGAATDFASIGLNSRLGIVYVQNIQKSSNSFVNFYADSGVDFSFFPATNSTFVISPDITLGIDSAFGIAPALKALMGASATAYYIQTFAATNSGVFGLGLGAYVGLRYEPSNQIEFNTEAHLNLYPLSSNVLAYNIGASLYYAIIPQIKMGLYTGYNGGFYIGLGGQYVDKPGTLGTPGNYMP